MRKQGKTREIIKKHNKKTRRTAENNGKQRAWENREKHAKTGKHRKTSWENRGKHRKTRENTGKQGNKRKQEKTRGKSGKRRKTVENRENLEKLKGI